MPTGHTLLADWMFLIAAIFALVYAISLAVPQAIHGKTVAALGALSLMFVAVGLWVL